MLINPFCKSSKEGIFKTVFFSALLFICVVIRKHKQSFACFFDKKQFPLQGFQSR